MVKDFIKEGSIYALAGIAAKGVSLFMIPIFTYYFTTRDYGRIEILFVITILSSGILSWQLGQGLIRYVSQHQRDEKRKMYLGSTALFFSLATYLIGSGVLIVFGTYILDAFGLNEVIAYKTFVLCMIALFLNGIFSFFGAHLQALRKKNQYAFANFIHSFLGITATYFFVVVLDKSINGIFYATIATVPISLFYQFIILRHEYKLLFSVSILRQLLNYSIPLIPGAIAIILLSITDRIMLSYLTTTSTLGIYSVALKFAFGFQIIIQGFGTAINPLTFEKHTIPGTSKSIDLLLSKYIKIGGLSVLLLSMFSKDIVEFFTQVPYYNAQYVLPMLFASAWVQGVSMFALGLFISKKTLKISLITCVSVIVNVSLNFLLIPIFDIKGAALATVLSALFNVVFLVYYSRKAFPLKVKTSDIMIFAFILILIITLSTSEIGRIFAFVSWSFKALIALFIGILIFINYRKMQTHIHS